MAGGFEVFFERKGREGFAKERKNQISKNAASFATFAASLRLLRSKTGFKSPPACG
jgi:hypothetical protein